MQLLCWMVLSAAVGYSASQHRGIDTRDVTDTHDVTDEDALMDTDGELVECPVCTFNSENEWCPIKKNGKRYKRCMFGTYRNGVCGNRRDCYRGPKEYCTEKMEDDSLGLKCANGYMCHSGLHECIGLFNDVDSVLLSRLSHLYYRLPADDSYKSYMDYPSIRTRGIP